MAVFSYVGGSVSMATGSYGNLAIRKGAQIAAPNTITVSARSFTEGTPASGLFDPVDRSLQYSKIAHGSGYNATKINFNTTEPYNSGAYSTSSYYTPYTTVFQDLDYSQYNTQSPSGEYWAHAQGYLNSEFGTAIAVDKNRNAWVTGSTDYCSCTVTSIAASLTPAVSFPSNSTTPTAGTNDSGYFLLTSPFNHNIFGLTGVDTALVVQTNSWLGFQPLINNTATALTATTPAWANIQIGAGQASCQRVYFGTFGTAPNRTYRIRFEGTNATTGTLGSPNMVWEFILYESTPNIFDIQIGTWTPPASSSYGITDGTTYFGSNVFSNTVVPAANTGWRFTTGNVTAGSSGNNITLVKYSNKGKFHQNKDFFPYDANDDLVVLSIGRNGSDVGESIKIGSDGRIYILYTSNSQGYVSGVANNDLGVIKIDPDYLYKVAAVSNATVWNKSFGTTSGDSAQSFDIDANDNLYITGFTAGSGQGGNDVIVIKVDKLGNVIWKKTYGASTAGDLGNAIKITPDGNHLYIWGYSGSTPLVGTSTDWFLLKVNSSDGVIVWQKHFNIGATTQGQVFENSIDVDPDGNVYVNGFAASSPQSYFVAKLDSSGNFKWSRNVGALTSNPDAGTSIKYKKGFLYIGGQDSSTINNSEGFGLGVSKLDANTGQLISNYVVGGINTEYAFALEVDDYNDIYATGITNTSLPGLTSASGVNALTTKFILDTPQGGFTVSGDAGVWSSTTAKRYTTSQQVFTPENIVFQNDLIATGQQFIFVGTTSETQTKFEKEFRFSGSGSLPALTSTLEQIPIQTTQYLQRTNVLSDSTEYFRTNFSSLLQVSNVVNPITGVLETPSRIYNGVASSGGGVFPAYLTPVSNTGVFASNTKVVLSIFAKANNFNKFRLLAYADRFGSSGALPDISVEFNLTTGVATNIQATNAPLAYGIIPYADGWYRCYFIVNLRVSSDQSGGAGWFQIRYTPDSVTGSSVYFYGPQVQKDVLTSYVENTSSVSSLTTTAYIEDDNVNTESTFDTPVTTPSTQLFTLSGTPTITYKNALNKPVQTYSGSSDLSLLNGYEVVFDPDLYTGKVQYRVYDSILYSTEKFEKEFRFSGSGSIASSGVNVIADVTFKGGVGAPSTQLFTIGSGYTSIKATSAFLCNIGNNLLPDTEKIDTWVKINSVNVSVDVTSAPNGTLTADKFIENTLSVGPTSHKVIARAVTLIPSTNYTVSIFVKAAERTNILMHLRKSDYSTRFGGFFDLTTQTFTSEVAAGATLTSYSIIPYPNNWYRISISGNIATNSDGVITLYLLNNANNIEYAGDGTSGMFVWGAKLELGSIATPYLSGNGVRLYDNYINTSGDARTKSPNRFIGSSPIEYYPPSQVVLGNEENFRASEIKTDATAFYRFQKGAFSATGSIASGDTAFKSTTNVAFIPLNTLLLFNTNVFTKLAMRYAGKSPTTPFGGLDIIFEELEANAPPQQFKYSGAASEPTKAFKWIGGPQQVSSITGTAVEKNTEAYAVSGQLTTGLEASAKVIFRPFDATDSDPLFSINGQHGTRVFVPNWIATGSTATSGSLSNLKRSSSWVGSSPLQYFDPQEVVFEDGENFGASEFKYGSTATYEYIKPPYAGSGFISTGLSGTAAVVFNPPDEAASVQLFSISGAYSNLRFTKKSSEASGNISITGAATPPISKYAWVGSSPIEYFDAGQIVFEDGENFRASEFKYDSTSLYRFQKANFSGSGTIVGDPNASAAVVFNPPEEISLFYFEGSYSNLKSTSRNVITAAPLFTGASGSAVVAFNPPDTSAETQLFTVTGSLVEKYTKGLYTGDGYINSSDFGSAKVTFRPFDATDSDPLFSINGQHGTRVFVPNWITTGRFVSQAGVNEAVLKQSSAWVGSSPIEYFDPYQVVFEDGENFGASEFKYGSTATYEYIKPPYVGSGFISTGLSGTAAVVFNSPDTSAGIQLFTVSGAYSNLRFIKKVPQDASSLVVTITGAASQPISNYSWVGSSPSAYYNSYNIVFGEDENGIPTEYRNTSTSIYRTQSAYSGSGLTSIGGTVVEVYKNGPWVSVNGVINITGSYSNFQFISQAGEAPVLFQISGAATQIKSGYAWVGLSPSTYFSAGQAVFEDGENFGNTTFKYESSGSYRFQNAAFSGAGSIASDNLGSATVTFNPPDTAAAIQLFTISGQHGTRVFVPSWPGSGSTTLSGFGSQSIQYANFTGNSPSAYIDPYEVVFGEEENYGSTDISLSGYSRFSATPTTEVGSGALFSDGFFSNLKATFRPFDATDSEQLFSINGQHGTRVFVPNWNVTGSITTDNSGTYNTTSKWIGSSPIQYFDPQEVVFEDGENFRASEFKYDSTALYRFQKGTFNGSGSIASSDLGSAEVTFRPVDATDTDFLFSISGSAGVKLRDYVWVSAVVEYDPYEYVINDEFIIPDFIKIKTTFEWDNTNNIYRSLTKESITKDLGSGFVGASLVDQDIQGFLNASVPSGVGLDIALETVTGSGSGATVSYFSANNQIAFIEIATSAGSGYIQGDVLRLPVGSNPTITLGSLVNATVFGSAIIQGNVGTRTFVPNWRGSGTISIFGVVLDKHIDTASGSGNLFAASGASQSVGVNPPDDTALFVISNSATEKHIDRTSGSGSATVTGTAIESHTDVTAGSGEAVFGDGSPVAQVIRYVAPTGSITFSQSATAAVTFNPPEADPLFTLSGSATESQTDITSGSGSIATDISAVSRVVFNPADTEQLFEVTGSYSDLKFTSDYTATGTISVAGTVVESHTNITSGSGTATFTGAAAESQTDIAVPGAGTIEFSGEALDEYASGGLRGSGTLFIIDGGSARVTFNPPEGNQLFDVSGSFSDIKITSDYNATGSVTIEGNVGSRVFVPNWIGSGTITVTGESTQKHVDITSGSGALFTDGFVSNLKATFRSVSDVGLFDVTGTVTEKHVDRTSGSGSATFAGAASESQIDITSGSGTLFSGGFYSDLRVTFNPTEEPALFAITGSVSQKQTSKESGSGSVTLSGTLVEKHIDIASGSGSIASGFNASASVTFRPFDATDTDSLFSILGSAIEKNTESYVGSGTVTFSGTAAESQRNITSGSGALFTDGFFSNLKATFRPFDATDLDPLFSINGSAVEKNTESYVGAGSTTISGFIIEKHIEVASGSGSLFSASGAAEAFGANPPEDTALFTIDGAATQKYFATNIGSGSIVTSFGGTATVTFNPPEDTQLFSVSGTYSNLKFISANTVSGSATFSGTVVEKFTSANSVSGTTTFSGTAVEKQTDITSGSGSLFTASGASQSVGANPPEDTALFSVSGTYSNLKYTSAWVGTGTLFTVSGAAERVTFNPPEDTQLFVVTGAVLQVQTNIALPGSGSLFTAFGGTASVTFNPPEDTQLFDVSGTYSDLKFISANVASGSATFSGTLVEKFASANVVSGTAEFSGTAVEKQTDITSGSGSLFAASGAAEAFGANPPEDTALFDISGTYSDLKSTSAYVGSGSLFTFSGAVVVATISEIGTGLFDIGDTAIESTTYKTIDGTGSLFGFGGGVESVTFDPVENTQLFQVSGEVYVTTSFGYGGGELALTGSGQAIFRRALVPQFGSGEILSSGESANKKIFAPFVGSGSLFAASGSAQATTNVPPIDPVIWEDDLRTTLYLASGSASVSRTIIDDNDVTINISGSGIARTVLPERVFATII